MSGTLHGLGIGPGDPELITLKAVRLLRECPVLAYPAPEDGESLARTLVASHIPSGRIEVAIRTPYAVDPLPARRIYDQAAGVLAGHLEAGRDVAVLCEGDPFFYGSFMYLFSRLAGRFSVEVVPGVSSVMAAAALAGVPLVSRNEVLTVIPAPLPALDLARCLRDTDAAAILKLGRHFAKVRRVLEELDLTARSCYVERATMAGGRAVPVTEVDPASVPYFSMILVRTGKEEQS